jgi:hypothetical protein
VPQWCLTAPGAPPSEDNTLLFDVGAEFCTDDNEIAVLDEAVDDARDVDVVDDLDCDVLAVEDPDPAL